MRSESKLVQPLEHIETNEGTNIAQDHSHAWHSQSQRAVADPCRHLEVTTGARVAEQEPSAITAADVGDATGEPRAAYTRATRDEAGSQVQAESSACGQRSSR